MERGDASGVAWDEALHLTQASWSPRGDRIAFDGRSWSAGPLPASWGEPARSRRRVDGGGLKEIARIPGLPLGRRAAVVSRS